METVVTAEVAGARNLLKQLTTQISEIVRGMERHIFVGNMIANLPEDQRVELRRLLNSILLKMRENKASDFDIGGNGAQGKVWYRVFGAKRPDDAWGTFTLDETSLLIQNILSDRQRQFFYDKRNLDFSYALAVKNETFRYRADAYLDLEEIALNMRAINDKIYPISELVFHPEVLKVLALRHTKEGMILITGITGSGKSTTLDSVIDMNNHDVNGDIVIIGSPIEYVHKSDKCIIRHREVGRDTLSFKEGCIEALRQDPDIVMIAEMRDSDTILTALEITDSGHKVFSTLHTASAVESIDRIVAEVPPEEQERVWQRLADVLKCVVSQKLVPSLDGKRVLVKEVLIANASVRAAIKNKNTSEIYQMIAEGSDIGMITMEQDLKRLYVQRRVSRDTALNYANNKRRMEQLLQMM
ncbi:MAG TPA: PilT/PilU family type 4a pilus ATPase [Candidatus Acidoferrales bacterium]|nr:PilT/PilU family type 4a pilus ATPase [Candidatus Acidoferrales bacterium]